MTYSAMPAHIARSEGIKVRISETAAEHMQVEPGWRVMSRAEATTGLWFCEMLAVPDRSDPMPRGHRIALQALARQLRPRLGQQ